MWHNNSGRGLGRAQRGMVSLLFLLVGAPLCLFLLCLALELTHFFGVHDDIQRVLDRETRASLTKGRSSREVEQGIALNLIGFADLVDISSITSTKESGWSESHMEGRFRGIFSELVFRLTGTSNVLLPIKVHSRVRKLSSRSLVVLDRTIWADAMRCEDPNLINLQKFADRLCGSMLASGNAVIRFAVFPGEHQAVELLSEVEGGDVVERCRMRQRDVVFDAASLAGSTRLVAPEEVALSLQQLVYSELFNAPADSRALVLLQSAAVEDRMRFSDAAFSIIDEQMRAQQYTLVGIHTLVGPESFVKDARSTPGGEGLLLYRLGIKPEELESANIQAAIQGRVSERTLLVF